MHGTSRFAGRGATGGVLCAILVAVLVLVLATGASGACAAEGRGAAGAVPGTPSDGATEQTAAGADVEVRAPGRRTAPAPPRAVRPARPGPQLAAPQLPIGHIPPPVSPDVRPLRCVVMRC